MTAAKRARTPRWICSACLTPAGPRWPGSRCKACGRFSGALVSLERARELGLPLPMALARPAGVKPVRRYATGSRSLDAVLGGGAACGCVTLVCAPAGLGKTTLLLGSSRALATARRRFVYVVAEGGRAAFADLAARLDVNQQRLWLLRAATIDELRVHVERVGPAVLVLDSLNGLADAIGRQPLDVLAEVAEIARATGGASFITVHLNREGDVAGPERMKNVVDVVLWIDGKPTDAWRGLRTSKNRFGDTSVKASMRMTARGLVDDETPAVPRRLLPPGCALGLVRADGSVRVVEVEAAITPPVSSPRRIVAHGLNTARVATLVTIAEREGVKVDGDVVVRLAGGASSNDVVLDAAVLAALWSTATSRALPADVIACGEVALDAVLRAASGVEIPSGLRLLGAPGQPLVGALATAHLRAV